MQTYSLLYMRARGPDKNVTIQFSCMITHEFDSKIIKDKLAEATGSFSYAAYFYMLLIGLYLQVTNFVIH